MKKGAKPNLLWTLLGGVAVAASYFVWARPKHRQWGATDEEAIRHLPGDDLLPDASSSATHAITILAPPSEVWLWIAQLGQGRGGFYSYALLENAMGMDVHDAHEVHPEWQEVKRGDTILFHPKLPGAQVRLLRREKHLVIGSDLDAPDGSTWAFVLQNVGDGRTRFIVRLRTQDHSGLGRLGDLLIVEPAHFVMERKMMLTIKKLAENRFRASSLAA